MSSLQAHEVWHLLFRRNKQFSSKQSLHLLSHQEEWSYIVCGKWTDLESIMLSKITQPQKDNYHVFLPKCNSYLSIYLLSFFCHLFIICPILTIYLELSTNYLSYLYASYLSSITYFFVLSISMYYVCCKSERGTIWCQERSPKR